ncbi:hypothetical protein OB69_04935 [Roseivirga seohaensis subsp. aquiponti]|uniref:Uncharacterized protein n=1 Tax=Roseivirga seohaensis subsp. aquiponti TaxID=1566026 RepID=A0A0L8AN24_9BACT|nr:hypothetical protein [Roseivirga seohaensis]KOF03646.1 hypothetical protein OB69_04935 [Roseivirga seohaensis subsp. aquiponti]
METLLSYLESNWPNISFYIVLIISVILSFKWVLKNVLDEYKALLRETRENNKNSIDDTHTILNQYKDWNTQINSEIRVLYDRIEILKKQLSERDLVIENLQSTTNKMQTEFEQYNNKIKEFFSSELSREDYSDLRINIKALFSERDRILEDLELVWKTLLRFSVVDEQIEKELVGAKTQRDSRIKKDI